MFRPKFCYELRDIKNKWNIPWILGGDFNVIKFQQEKKGGDGKCKR